MSQTRPATDGPRVAVFAPAPVLVCTFEHPHDRAGPEVAVNVGGHGPWVARAVSALGAGAVLVVPLGGDTGAVAHHLLAGGPYELRPVRTAAATACYVEERRGEERTCVRDAGPGRLGRRELDDLYSAALEAALEADVCAITGSPWPGTLDSSVFGRMAADLASLGRLTVVDLSGEQLVAALEGGVDWVKVADDELVDDPRSAGAGGSHESPGGPGHHGDASVEAGLWVEAERLAGAGARERGVVVSRSVHAPSLVIADGRRFRVRSPVLKTVGARGSGDTMTAALATGLAAGRPVVDVLAWSAAAGAANAVQRSSAAPAADLVERLAAAVTIEELDR